MCEVYSVGTTLSITSLYLLRRSFCSILTSARVRLSHVYVTLRILFLEQHLTNQQISVALYSRTLLPLSAHCTRCGNRAELGHSETCNISGKYPRHNAVVRAIARALETVAGVKVEIEPVSTEESLRRNDLRVRSTSALETATSEHDVKVYSLFASNAHSSLARHTPSPSSRQPIWDFTRSQAERYLGGIAKLARKNAPAGQGTFTAIVMSTGGLVEEDTMRLLEEWQKGIKDWDWAHFLGTLSLGLVRARAKVVSWD
jgi:hypothetical protein